MEEFGDMELGREVSDNNLNGENEIKRNTVIQVDDPDDNLDDAKD